MRGMLITKNYISNSALSPEFQTLTEIVSRHLHLNLISIDTTCTNDCSSQIYSSSSVQFQLILPPFTLQPKSESEDHSQLFSFILSKHCWFYLLNIFYMDPIFSVLSHCPCSGSHLRIFRTIRLQLQHFNFTFSNSHSTAVFLNANLLSLTWILSILNNSRGTKPRIQSLQTGISTVLIIARRIWP